jgi:hypothetical protein
VIDAILSHLVTGWLLTVAILIVALDILLRRRKSGALTVADLLGGLLYRLARFAMGVAVAYDRALVAFRKHRSSKPIEQQSVRVLRGMAVQGELF